MASANPISQILESSWLPAVLQGGRKKESLIQEKERA
jgi:hypothetical protein